MQKTFLLKTISLLSVFFLIFVLAINKSYASEPKGASVSPGYLEYNVNSGEVIKDKLEIKYISLQNPEIIYNFKEFDKKYQKGIESNLFKSISNVKVTRDSDKAILDINIDTQPLVDQTYFFGLTVILNNPGKDASVSSKIAFDIPIILTVNSSDTTESPKPFLKLEPKNSIFFQEKDINIKVQIDNKSKKLIGIGGEILFTNGNNEILYSEKIQVPEDRLLPATFFQEEVSNINLMSNSGALPYFGKIKVIYRGTIDNKRHIESQVTEIYLIPYLYIVYAVIMVLLMGSIIFYLSSKNRKKPTS